MKAPIDSHKLRDKPNIFIIEDNEDIGFILDYFLNEEGFSVKLFPTVMAFSNAFRSSIPDLFLIDVMLPDGNGIELCDEIKKDFRSANIPVLIMSANADKPSIEACEAEEFIPKPFDLQFLLDKIKTHLPAA
ncbi:response regulator transcription factor [Pedobacter heparinus]|uniref:response regulator transcription factor n=1 Tax=Pedobacter heparinus TaxID=984 RepID=UPI00292D2DB3|nr:response regulator [Pedobacter heparinus]